MPVTLKDIAKETGVSVSTVSRVLSGDKAISAQTQKLVRRAAKKMGYRVNTVARSLKMSRTYTVGFVCPEITNEFFMKIAKGVEQELKKKGYSMIICNSNENVKDEERSLRILLEKCVDGVIIIPCSNEGAHIKRLCGGVCPVVLADRMVDGMKTDAVLVNNEAASFALVDGLIRRGKRRIAFVGGNELITSAKERFSGYLKALKENNIVVEPEIIKFGDFYLQSGYDIMREFCEMDHAPEDFFISNYFMQVGAEQYLQEYQKEREGRITVVGFDDMEASPLFRFTEVAAAQPMVAIGAEAARLLQRRMAGDVDSFPLISRFDVDWIKRKSGR